MDRTIQTHCDFSDPRDALGITPITAAAFQYKQSDCYEVASSTSEISQPTIIIDAGYTGPNLQEVLVIAGVFLFILSYQFWPKLSAMRNEKP